MEFEDSITSNDTSNCVAESVEVLHEHLCSSLNEVDNIINTEEVVMDKNEESVVVLNSSNIVDECEEVHRVSVSSLNVIDNGINPEQIAPDKAEESIAVAESEEFYQHSDSALNIDIPANTEVDLESADNTTNNVSDSQEIQ